MSAETLIRLGAWAAAIAALILATAAILVYMERKVLGFLQVRLGPTKVGPRGILQSIADVVKLLSKEDIVPNAADRKLFLLAPVVAFFPVFTSFVVIPFAPHLEATNLSIGIFLILAISSLTTLGIIMAGWASNSKYALLGGFRSAAQMISYEIPLVLSILGVVMLAGSLNLEKIVQAQRHIWFIIPEILGFLVFITAAIAETNRTPFDLPEAESELVAGFHVEYSGMRFAFFFLAEYAEVFLIAALTTILFLGGWNSFFGLSFLPPVVWFFLKTYLVIFFVIWIRATLPRVRIDQLLTFSWKFLLPLSLINIFLTGFFEALYR